jgi:hypothetical protein
VASDDAIAGRWEKAVDGAELAVDFYLTYSKVPEG